MQSRLTSLADAPAPHPERVAGASLRRLGSDWLVVGDAGGHAVFSEEELRRFLAGTLPDAEPAAQRARAAGLRRDALDFGALAASLETRALLRWPGPSVHTVSVTRRCNMKCVYCHASVVGEGADGYDMTPETARRTVDFIFSTPNPSLMLEFQGGEPLLNWPVVRYIASYARKRAEWEGRRLSIGLISNFTLLDDAKTRELAALGVSFCTSLDGPADLHDGNRVRLGGTSHAEVVARLRELQRLRAEGLAIDTPNAICTVTRASLPRAREIVDQVADLGLERVQLGPLDPVGFASRAWDAVGYEPEAYLAFYAEALDRILELSRQGRRVYEKTALILLQRILLGEHWRFPNGEGLCRLAYGFDGSIYASEEGRLLANGGDASFRLGSVRETAYRDVLDHPTVRAALLAQHKWLQPMCSQCAYASFCTVVPTMNRAEQGSLWGRMPESRWCRILMGTFDLLFKKLQDPADRKTLESWLEFKDR